MIGRTLCTDSKDLLFLSETQGRRIVNRGRLGYRNRRVDCCLVCVCVDRFGLEEVQQVPRVVVIVAVRFRCGIMCLPIVYRPCRWARKLNRATEIPLSIWLKSSDFLLEFGLAITNENAKASMAWRTEVKPWFLKKSGDSPQKRSCRTRSGPLLAYNCFARLITSNGCVPISTFGFADPSQRSPSQDNG